ncbi:MAG: efflux RND transporter periplasmic adaptor subunit [Candidatus Krumholzibacteria bacterium]|jgi:HlyD family secretion protein|nr:efflux RND transporter periplasmic adaptor subunit [Candidatus Krumholzibacteria bacterium]
MRKKYWIILAVVIVVAALVAVNLKAKRGKPLPVQTEKVEARDLSMVISASGSIRPKRQVDISASTIGKVTRVAVKEGDLVKKGQFLIQIDPVQLESTVEQIRASLEAAQAAGISAEVQLKKAESDLGRVRTLFERELATEQDVERAQTDYDVSVSNLDSARNQVRQQQALLESARHNLREVTITSGMDGIVTRLNVEEGEIAIMGTLNNAGTVLMTVADLSTIETEVEVDETEVVNIRIGNRAKVTLDAFPDTSYAGEVTEVGNSPILSSGQQGVDFKVVITITDTIPDVRPGLSADAEITVAEREKAVSIPIQSLTVRREKDLKDYAAADSTSGSDGEKEIEGVFTVDRDRANFTPVSVGISSQKHFEVLKGLKGDEEVVSGNFKAIRDLKDGQRIKVEKKALKK